MTAASFCSWVNGTLLPHSTLEPGYPRIISVESARKWLHELGFFIVDKKKDVYYDGHEREDVIESRRKYLRKMVAVGFLNPDNAPTEEAKSSLPADLEAPPLERREKNILLFHDESAFQVNEDDPRLSRRSSGQRAKIQGSWFPIL